MTVTAAPRGAQSGALTALGRHRVGFIFIIAANDDLYHNLHTASTGTTAVQLDLSSDNIHLMNSSETL
ncbi:MAG: hypothetical protein ACN4GZ_15795 [Acidimicrobiales bacterium]